MAEEAKIQFEVDASQILAKLHLAGVQAVQYGKPNGVEEFIVNTAIKNDDKKAKPENPGKVTFDLSNKQGTYEVGFATTIEYNYGENNQKEVEDLNAIYTMVKDFANNEDKEEIGKKIDKNKEKNLEQAQSEFAKIYPQIKTQLKDNKIVKDFKHATPEEIKVVYDEINDNNKEQNKENSENGREIALKEAGENAIKQLEAYMNNFAGPDKGSKVKDQICCIPISDAIKDSNDPNLIKVYEIQSRPEKELELLKKQAENSKDKTVVEHICFIVKYDIELNR